MKKIKFIYGILFLIVLASSCAEIEGIDQDLSFLNTISTSNPSKIFEISNDNSGIVKITPLGEGVLSFTVNFGHGTGADASAVVKPGGSATHTYPEGSYTVGIVATDIAGVSTTTTYPLTVTYRAPEDLVVTIEGDVEVSAKALYAKSFLVYYGDVANEVGTPMAIGQKLPAHTYAEGGPYTLKVVALSGGAATTQFMKTLSNLPMTFEGTFLADTTIKGTGQAFEIVANPGAGGLNTSATVGKFIRGKEGSSSVTFKLDIPINMALGKKIKLLVYNTDPAQIGKKMNFELASAVGGVPKDGVGLVKVAVTKSGEWEELIFDYSAIAGITSTTKFSQFVIRFNTTAVIPGTIVYIDDIRITN
jgi:hypothetical protein